MTRVFTDMEIWVEVRLRVLAGELSKRAACREYEIHWQTLEKILSHSEPPGYQKTKPRSSMVDAFEPIIEEILKSDRQVHRKQRHTARRIFERLRDEHGYVGGETIVKDAVLAWKQHHREVFLPLSLPPDNPRTTQDSLPAAGQALPDGLSTRRTPTKGFRFAFYISSPFPKHAWRNHIDRSGERCGDNSAGVIQLMATKAFFCRAHDCRNPVDSTKRLADIPVPLPPQEEPS